MGESQRQQIQQLIAEDETFESEITHASSAADAVRFARHRHIDATVEDFASTDGALSELELAVTSDPPFSPTISRDNICY
jgi:hypothetical protein